MHIYLIDVYKNSVSLYEGALNVARTISILDSYKINTFHMMHYSCTFDRTIILRDISLGLWQWLCYTCSRIDKVYIFKYTKANEAMFLA